MSMREHDRVAWARSKIREQAIDALTDELRGLTFGSAVAPQAPVGTLVADVNGTPSLVRAVVPFHELVPPGRALAEARELARLDCSDKRARQDEVEPAVSQLGPESTCSLAAVLGQRDVGSSRVPPAQAPFRLSVPDENDLG